MLSPFSDELWKFDITSLYKNHNGEVTVQKLLSLDKPLRNFGYSYDDGVLMIAGGESSDYKSTDSVSVYVEKTDKWQRLAHLALPKPRLNFQLLKVEDFTGLQCKFSKGTLKMKNSTQQCLSKCATYSVYRVLPSSYLYFQN